MEKTFYDAVEHGKVEEVKSILRKNPSLNVNWKIMTGPPFASPAIMAMTLLSPSSLPIPTSIPI